MSMKPRSPFVNAAENALKDAVRNFLLCPFNYPREANQCILQLHHGLELLLNEHFRKIGIKDVDQLSMFMKVEKQNWYVANGFCGSIGHLIATRTFTHIYKAH